MMRALRLLAILAMFAVIAAGCSNAPAGSSMSSDSASGSPASAREKAVQFSACMRENGVSDFPDPDASGEFPDFGISVSVSVWKAAVGACKELQPPGSLSAHMNPEQLSAALKFAQCVRAHGVKDFPDPVNGQPLIDTTKIPSTDTQAGMAILNAATAKCGDLLGDTTGGQG